MPLYLSFFSGCLQIHAGLEENFSFKSLSPVVSRQIIKFFFVEYVDVLQNFNANVLFKVFKMQCFVSP